MSSYTDNCVELWRAVFRQAVKDLTHPCEKVRLETLEWFNSYDYKLILSITEFKDGET